MEHKRSFKKSLEKFLNPIIVWFYSIPRNIYAFIAPNGKLNKGRLALLICGIVMALALVVAGIWGIAAHFSKDGGGDDDPTQYTEDNDFPSDSSFGVGDANSLKDMLKNWYEKPGELASSSSVINVLLVGEHDGLSDAIMLASLNKTTKQISLVSIPRDSFTYMEIDGEGRFDKLNHSHSWGGTETLVKTVEKDLKIRIDHWACVDFKSFAKVVDILGGVRITVTEAESHEVNSRPRTYGGGINLPFGENVELNGKQALAYSRIRNIGSDMERTNRQRKVISQIIAKAKDASIEQVTKMAGEVFKNVKTDMNLLDMTNLGLKALSEGWAKYEIASIEFPEDKELRRPTYMAGTWSKPYGTTFLWIIDFPRAARDLQLLFYGQTNINIDDSTPSVLDFLTPPPQPTQPYVPPAATTAAKPSGTTLPPKNTTTAPPAVTTTAAPPVTTTSPPVTTTAPPVTITAPPVTTTAPPTTTAPTTTPPSASETMPPSESNSTE